MGFININTIGAYVFVVVMLAIVRHGPGLQKTEETLRELVPPVFLLVYSALGGLVLYSFLAANPSMHPLLGWPLWFLRTASIIIHEAGHGLLFFAPEIIHVAAGTALEILLPTVLLIVLLVRRYFYTTALCFLWLSLSLQGTARYLADARAQKLPLLGGAKIHDWHYLLSGAGILEYDHFIARCVFALAILAFCGSLITIGRIFYEQRFGI